MATPDIRQITGGGLPAFSIPPFDYIAITYVGSTNNFATVKYYQGGSTGRLMTTLTFTYVAAGAADDDDIATITQSV